MALIINKGNYTNVASITVVGLTIIQYVKPYKLQYLNRDEKIIVNK